MVRAGGEDAQSVEQRQERICVLCHAHECVGLLPVVPCGRVGDAKCCQCRFNPIDDLWGIGVPTVRMFGPADGPAVAGTHIRQGTDKFHYGTRKNEGLKAVAELACE